MAVQRDLTPILAATGQESPSITLTGPRQSGKTTLSRAVFPQHSYVSLEAPDVRAFASEDPRAFLSQYPDGAIIDEVQHRRPRLPTPGSRGVRGLVHPHSRAVRTPLSGHHLQPRLLTVGEGLRQPYGHCSCHRQDRPPLDHPGVRRPQLSDRGSSTASSTGGLPARIIDAHRQK